MTVGEFMTALKYLRGSDSITVTIDAAAFERAMEMATGGPEIMSTAQAAAVFGFSAKRWRRWAEADRIDGAWQEDGKRGPWRLPRDGCRQLIEEEAARGRARAKNTRIKKGIANAGRTSATSGGRRVGSHQSPLPPTGRSVRRGPRKA